MGCISSKQRRARQYATGDEFFSNIAQAEEVSRKDEALKNSQQAATTVNEANGRAVDNAQPTKLDPKDFQFVNCKDEVKIKPPGSINGQSFTIDKCENCDIYVLDVCGQVTIDDCKGCRLYIGPTDGSVSIRDSSGCTLAAVCRQLRTRDCTECNFALYCRTKPIVESSSGMAFACLDLSYPQLKDHMRSAKLSSLHNFWYDIFDFTPKDGNWRLLPRGTTSRALLAPVPQEVAELLGGPGEGGLATETGGEPPRAAEAPELSPLLLTLGQRPPPPLADGMSYIFALFNSAQHDEALQFAREAATQGWLLNTNEARLIPTVAKALAAEAGWTKSVMKTLSSGGLAGCVGLELLVPAGDDPQVHQQVKQLGGQLSTSGVAGERFRTAGLDG